MRGFARTFAGLMMFDALFGLAFPRAGMRLVREFSCLSTTAIRWLAGWQLLMAGLTLYLAMQPMAGAARMTEMAPSERRQAA